jgi:hypothetical protein
MRAGNEEGVGGGDPLLLVRREGVRSGHARQGFSRAYLLLPLTCLDVFLTIAIHLLGTHINACAWLHFCLAVEPQATAGGKINDQEANDRVPTEVLSQRVARRRGCRNADCALVYCLDKTRLPRQQRGPYPCLGVDRAYHHYRLQPQEFPGTGWNLMVQALSDAARPLKYPRAPLYGKLPGMEDWLHCSLPLLIFRYSSCVRIMSSPAARRARLPGSVLGAHLLSSCAGRLC